MCNMRDNERRDDRRIPDKDAADAPQGRPMASYTPAQRRMIQKGLRILAKVAIRSYMRGSGDRPQTEAADGEESR